MSSNTDRKAQAQTSDTNNKNASQQQDSGARSYPTVSIYGLPFSKMDMQETVNYLSNVIHLRIPTQVITGNPIMVMAGLENPDYYRVMEEAELIVPDGAGVVWASEYVGQPVKERVAGFDLMHRLLETGEKHRWSVFLLGTTQETIEESAERLKQQYPLIRFVGVRNGFFGPGEDAKVIEEIRRANPDMLFVARALDNQEPWIGRYKQELGVPVMMGVGGSFDIIAGKLKRAPVLFQKLRLEWFYRLLQQPSRYKRMLVLPKFMLKVVREKENVTKRRPTP
ncbi:WecB/TagA/CpsF family glycosyltransferase [Paenibacillus tarimensis]